jgi:DNA-directed RNA polymerase specialized sigma24 family protein
MTERTITRARAGDEEAFRELTDPYRRELQAHCYRIVGSTQDAEDLVQETLLAAWRGLEQFEERASIRAWLYRIATNRCASCGPLAREPRPAATPRVRPPCPRAAELRAQPRKLALAESRSRTAGCKLSDLPMRPCSVCIAVWPTREGSVADGDPSLGWSARAAAGGRRGVPVRR